LPVQGAETETHFEFTKVFLEKFVPKIPNHESSPTLREEIFARVLRIWKI